MWSIKTLITVTSATVILGASVLNSTLQEEKEKEIAMKLGKVAQDVDSPPCVRLYYLLEKYSEEYGVPFEIAIGVAREETGYLGPFHWSYDPKRISSASAYGAMQIQVPTANDQWDDHVTSKMLLNDLELNVHISMKLLAKLKSKFGSWQEALGAYNTGRPIVNDYALRIASGRSNPLRS